MRIGRNEDTPMLISSKILSDSVYLLGDSVFGPIFCVARSGLPGLRSGLYLVWPSFFPLFPPIALENSTRRFKDVGTTLQKRPGAE